MPTKPREPVEKVCENCGGTFKTRHPHRARYCSSRCRSEVWDRAHRVEDKEAFAREVIRRYERDRKRKWRLGKK